MNVSPLWTATEAMEATAGRTVGNWTATGVSIDSRTLEAGDLFVAISGPNYDGHSFIPDAFRAGAAAAVVADYSNHKLEDKPGIVVKDPLEALEQLAGTARRRTDAKVVAITGSVGKTSTKEALAYVLAKQGETSASKNSLNNHWGVPLSLARLPKWADFGIFEIGMNRPGEIIPLTTLVGPDVALVTAITAAHMEFFDSLKDIARAKAEIFMGLNAGTAIINRDTKYFDVLYSRALKNGAAKVISFGRRFDADLRLIECVNTSNGYSIEASWNGKSIKYNLRQPGVHWPVNSLAVLAATDALGGDLYVAASDLTNLPPLPGRGMMHVLDWNNGSIRLIDDSYNANPASMRAALETLGRIEPDGGRRIAILGDMLELGKTSKCAHAGLIEHIKTNSIDIVFLAGKEMSALAEIIDSSCFIAHAETAEDLLPALLEVLKAGDVVSVKASNAMQMGKIVDALVAPTAHSHTVNGN